MSDKEKKGVISHRIKEIRIYPNGESEMPLKSIEFNFPIYCDGKESFVGKYTRDSENEFLSLTDIARYRSDDPAAVI